MDNFQIKKELIFCIEIQVDVNGGDSTAMLQLLHPICTLLNVDHHFKEYAIKKEKEEKKKDGSFLILNVMNL